MLMNYIMKLKISVVKMDKKKIKKELLELKSQKIISVNDKYRIQKLQQLLDKEI
jgi:hypothetical protein